MWAHPHWMQKISSFAVMLGYLLLGIEASVMQEHGHSAVSTQSLHILLAPSVMTHAFLADLPNDRSSYPADPCSRVMLISLAVFIVDFLADRATLGFDILLWVMLFCHNFTFKGNYYI